MLLTLLLLCLLLPLALGPAHHWALPYPLLPIVALPLARGLWTGSDRLERAGGLPLLPPSLLRLGSVRFGLLIAALFFSSWSGFMFIMAVALQTGAGLSPAASGRVFMPLGLAYFVAALLSTRIVARIGRAAALIFGCAVQMLGLVAVIITLRQVWPHPDMQTLAPALSLVGAGQALIVSSFFRIGLSDVPAEQAGAGSSVLSTVHQAALGLGSAVLGAVYCLALPDGGRLVALDAGIEAELALMALLVIAAWRWSRRGSGRHDEQVCPARLKVETATENSPL
jgi:predicted MFS family arabinose efflux permease